MDNLSSQNERLSYDEQLKILFPLLTGGIHGELMDKLLSQYEKLGLDEKLEVLLALYLLGKMQKWDFLTPEQEKMLIDNGKIILFDSGSLKWFEKESTMKFEREKAAEMANVFMAMLIRSFEQAIVEKLEYCSADEWESKSDEVKWSVDALLFYATYEISLEGLRDNMFTAFSGNVENSENKA